MAIRSPPLTIKYAISCRFSDILIILSLKTAFGFPCPAVETVLALFVHALSSHPLVYALSTEKFE